MVDNKKLVKFCTLFLVTLALPNYSLRFVFVFSLLVLYTSKILLEFYNNKKILDKIPGPKSDGFMGYFFGQYKEIIGSYKKNSNLCTILYEWTKKYGKIYKFQIGPKICVVFTEPEIVKEILVDKNFPKYEFIYKTLGYPFNERFGGIGLVSVTDKEVWKSRRSLYNPGFHKNELLEYFSEFNQKADGLIEKLRLTADGKTTILMLSKVNSMTLDVIASVAFGLDINTLNDPDNKLGKLITEAFEGVNSLYLDPLIQLNPLKYNKLLKNRQAIRDLRGDYARNHIHDRINKIKNDEYIPKDMFSSIIENTIDNADEENLIDDFLTLFIAGQETTANALIFTLMELGRNPEAYRKIKEEVDRVIGSKQEITINDLGNLEYTEAAFKEALRLYPGLAGISRQAPDDVVLGGYKIPKDTWVQVLPFSCGRDPDYFKEPEKYNPDRFMNLGENSNSMYFPFSLGPRNCIGQQFAKIEAKLVLAKIFQNFNYKLDPNQSFDMVEIFVLRPADGCRVVLSENK